MQQHREGVTAPSWVNPPGRKRAQPTWTVLQVLIGFVFVVVPAFVDVTPSWGRIVVQALGVLILLFALVYPLLEAMEPPAPTQPETFVRRFGGEESHPPERPSGGAQSEHEEPHSRPRPRVVSRRSH